MISVLGGLEIGWDDFGRGTPLLLFHPFPFDRRIWQPLARIVERKVRTLSIDFRGLGESEGMGSIDDAADDGAHLLDRLQLARVLVGGLSMGGYVALAFARRHAARLGGLLLANTRAGADSDEAREGRDRAIAQVVTHGPSVFAEELVPKLFARGSASQRDFALAIASLQTADGVAAALSAMRERQDATAGLRAIRVPTTVVSGTRDALIPPSEAAQLAAAIPGAELCEIEGVGHLSCVEAPEQLAVAVEQLALRAKL